MLAGLIFTNSIACEENKDKINLIFKLNINIYYSLVTRFALHAHDTWPCTRSQSRSLEIEFQRAQS